MSKKVCLIESEWALWCVHAERLGYASPAKLIRNILHNAERRLRADPSCLEDEIFKSTARPGPKTERSAIPDADELLRKQELAEMQKKKEAEEFLVKKHGTYFYVYNQRFEKWTWETKNWSKHHLYGHLPWHECVILHQRDTFVRHGFDPEMALDYAQRLNVDEYEDAKEIIDNALWLIKKFEDAKEARRREEQANEPKYIPPGAHDPNNKDCLCDACYSKIKNQQV